MRRYIDKEIYGMVDGISDDQFFDVWWGGFLLSVCE